MTDRANMLFVALETNIRTDDILELCKAIEQFRGVLKVELNVADQEAWLAQNRAKFDLQKKLWEIVK